MKNKRCLLFIFMLSDLQGESQDMTEGKKLKCRCDYRLAVEVPMYECNITGVITDSILMVAEPGSLFTVVSKTDDDQVIIRFWEWKQNPALNARLCFADSLCTTRKYFLVSGKFIGERSEERFKRNPGFTAGTILIPFKLRLQKFDFTKDITLGPAAGVRFRLSHFSSDFVNLIAGMGITSVTLDANTTDGVTEESSEVPALTPSLGFVFELSEIMQAGMFWGWDFIAHNDNLHFIYHGKTWMSFGFGYSLISTNEERGGQLDRKAK